MQNVRLNIKDKLVSRRFITKQINSKLLHCNATLSKREFFTGIT